MQRNRAIAGALVLLATGWAVLSLAQRAREESRERDVTLAVDWYEVSDLWARRSSSSSELLNHLHALGVRGIVISPLTLSELLQDHRIQPQAQFPINDPLDVSRIRFPDAKLGQQVEHELTARGVKDVISKQGSHGFTLERRSGHFTALKDIDVGYDKRLLSAVRQAGMVPVLRIVSDPWSTVEFQDASSLVRSLQEVPIGLFWGGEDLPGGLEAAPGWKSQIAHAGATQFLFEFKPTRAALRMARTLPASTYKAHTIPLGEFKDLSWGQQKARWIRAVDERMCRLLLLRVPPGVSGPQYDEQIRELASTLTARHFRLGFPWPRNYWTSITGMDQFLRPLVAWGLAILAPLFGLWWSMTNVIRAKVPMVHRWPVPLRQFLKLSVLTLVGAGVMAAVAGTPYTRLEIVPFRGVKLVFILSMAGALGMLYSWAELRHYFRQSVARWEILAGLVLAGGVGYLLLRTGNAPSGTRHSLEPAVREFLERVFIARPRFKEFALGHPLMILGLYIQTWVRQKQWPWDGRMILWAGMIGQISMVNTFCHLHSPLRMELLRSINGLLLGILMGGLLVLFTQRLVKEKGFS